MNLADRIIKFKEIKTLSKYESIVFGVIESINEKYLKINDQLPTINLMKQKLGYSGVTICKGYEELKRLGLIKAINTQGYYVCSTDTGTTTRIVLVSASIEHYQEKLYQIFRKELGEKFSMDVFVHNCNIDSFETILFRVKETRYDRYIIELMADPSVLPMLESFDPRKLLVLNNVFPLNCQFSYITMEFNENDHKRVLEHFD